MTTAPGNRRIRLAFVTPSLHAGGAERQMLILANELPRERYDVRFILLWERGAWASQAEAAGIPVHVLGLRPQLCARASIRCAIGLCRTLLRYVRLVHDVDVVDAWLVPGYTFVALAQPIARVPIVLAGRRSLLDGTLQKPWYRNAARAFAARRVAAVVANSRAAAFEAVSREGVDAAKVHTIPNAVVSVVVSRADRYRHRRAWGFTETDIVVGCVANYKLGKGLEAVIVAAARLQTRVPALRFVLVGDGPLRSRLEKQIRDYHLESTVVLNGAADDARLLYPAFDMLVHASASEGLPNVVLEAASAGLPIVATAVGGTGEILNSEENGLLLSDAEPDRVASAIFRLATDRRLRERLGRAAHERSLYFSPARLALSTSALYEQLVREECPPRVGGK